MALQLAERKSLSVRRSIAIMRVKGRRRTVYCIGGLLAVMAALRLFAPTPALALAPAPFVSGVGCEAADSHCFQMDALSIEGLTAYKPNALLPTYRAYLTREVSAADLVAIATAITDRYRADGYFLSRAVAPPQLRGGHVGQIRVYEGYISEVRVTGSAAPIVTRLAKGIQNRRPLRLSELERVLRLAADTPGMDVKSHLEPVEADPAQHRLVITATQKRWSVSTYVDNRGPKDAGPWQASMRAALNSTLLAGDQLALAVLTVPDRVRAFTFGELSYFAPIGARGAGLRGAVGISRSSEGGSPLSRLVGGESWEATISYLNPLVLSRRLTIWAQVTADARHLEHHWDPTTGYLDEVRALRGLITATEAATGHVLNLSAQIAAGERGSVAPGAAHTLSRPDASRDFWKANAHASYYRDIGAHAGVYLSADGQWTPNRLMSSEQFTVGGAPYGRGYDYADIYGDRGVAATVELRAGFNPRRAGITYVQGYSFVDAGKVWNSGPGGARQSLVSTGVGVRVRIGERVTLGVEAARRLTHTLAEPKLGWRPSVSLSTVF